MHNQPVAPLANINDEVYSPNKIEHTFETLTAKVSTHEDLQAETNPHLLTDLGRRDAGSTAPRKVLTMPTILASPTSNGAALQHQFVGSLRLLPPLPRDDVWSGALGSSAQQFPKDLVTLDCGYTGEVHYLVYKAGLNDRIGDAGTYAAWLDADRPRFDSRPPRCPRLNSLAHAYATYIPSGAEFVGDYDDDFDSFIAWRHSDSGVVIDVLGTSLLVDMREEDMDLRIEYSLCLGRERYGNDFDGVRHIVLDNPVRSRLLDEQFARPLWDPQFSSTATTVVEPSVRARFGAENGDRS